MKYDYVTVRALGDEDGACTILQIQNRRSLNGLYIPVMEVFGDLIAAAMTLFTISAVLQTGQYESQTRKCGNTKSFRWVYFPQLLRSSITIIYILMKIFLRMVFVCYKACSAQFQQKCSGEFPPALTLKRVCYTFAALHSN
jgi:hypothetical protein